jgi:putative ABC transport system permease protein
VKPLKLALLHLFRRPISTWIAIAAIAIAVATAGVMIKLFFLSQERFETLADEGQSIVGAKSGGIEILLGALNLEGEFPGFIPYNLFQTLQAKQAVHFEDGANSDPSQLRLVIPFLYFANYNGHRVIGTSPDFMKRPFAPDSPQLSEGRWVEESQHEVVLGADAANGAKVGDTVHLKPAGLDKETAEKIDLPAKVVGILKPTGKAWDFAIFSSVKDAQTAIVVSGLSSQSIWGPNVLHYFLIYQTPESYPGLKSLINERTVAQVVWVQDEIARLRDLTGTGRGFGLLLMGLILFLGSSSVATLMITRFESMTVQVAVLRAIGYSQRQLTSWLLWEGLILGGAACLIGGAIDAASFPFIRHLAGLDLTVVKSHLVLQTLIVWFAALLATMIAVGVPLLRLSKQNIHTSLKG